MTRFIVVVDSPVRAVEDLVPEIAEGQVRADAGATVHAQVSETAAMTPVRNAAIAMTGRGFIKLSAVFGEYPVFERLEER